MASAAKPHHVHPTSPFLTEDQREKAISVVRAKMEAREAKMTEAEKRDLAKLRATMKKDVEILRGIG
jgi:gamma-glutamyl phosphate reductase